jgi:DNA-binding NarL/FixJ family response regulator
VSVGSLEPAAPLAARLFVTERTVEAHVKQIFQKLGLRADPESHRRVLAVLAFLRAAHDRTGYGGSMR